MSKRSESEVLMQDEDSNKFQDDNLSTKIDDDDDDDSHPPGRIKAIVSTPPGTPPGITIPENNSTVAAS